MKLLWWRWWVLTVHGGCGNGRAGTRCCSRSWQPPPTTACRYLCAMVARRLDDADVAAPTLRTAAVLGTDIDLDLLARVVERSPSEVIDHLEQGIRLALLIEDHDGMRFRHEILREAIEAETTVARRSWIHARAAELLADRPDANPFELARHARLGGNTRLVARGLLEAAELARRRFDLTRRKRCWARHSPRRRTASRGSGAAGSG